MYYNDNFSKKATNTEFGINIDSKEIKTARELTKNLFEVFSDIPIAVYEFKLGISFATFRAWMNGYGDYFNDKIYTLADLFNVSVEFLLGRTDIPNSSGALDNPLDRAELLIQEYNRSKTDTTIS